MSTSEIRIAEDINARARTSQRTHFERFLEAIKNLPPPPCVGCPLKRKCAKQELACEMFWQYAHADDGKDWPYDTPPTREPNKAIFNALYTEDGIERRQEIRPRVKKGRLGRRPADDETVRFVRAATGTHDEIAKRALLSRAQVRRIRSGEAYKDVA